MPKIFKGIKYSGSNLPLSIGHNYGIHILNCSIWRFLNFLAKTGNHEAYKTCLHTVPSMEEYRAVDITLDLNNGDD